MGQTALNNLPYPELGEPADVPTDMRELAEAIDPLLAQAEVPIVSSLPSSPANGERVLYGPHPAFHVMWELRYNTAIPDAYKWQFLGGGALVGSNLTPATITSTTYADPAAGGMGAYVYCPLAGVYDFFTSASLNPPANGTVYMAFRFSAAAAFDGFMAAQVTAPTGGSIIVTAAGQNRFEVATAGQSVSQQFRVAGGATGLVENRRMHAFPIRVKG